jgi:hypothetical protein
MCGAKEPTSAVGFEVPEGFKADEHSYLLEWLLEPQRLPNEAVPATVIVRDGKLAC